MKGNNNGSYLLMKNAIKALLKRAGYDLRKLPDTPQVEVDGSIVRWHESGHELRFYIENRYDLIGKDIFNCRFFEREELNALSKIVSPKGTCVDVGANIGNHAIFFATLMEADKVIAFEPGDFAHPRLCFNIALNDLSDRVKIRKVALSEAPGEAEMRFIAEGNHGTLAILGQGEGEGATQTVKMERGDDLLKDEDVTLLKVDAERHEMAVLRGLHETIERCKPVILVEAAQCDRDKTEAHLASYGYTTQHAFERYGDIVNLIAVAR